jgi:hypothetical protein
MIPAFSIMRITARSGARVRCTTFARREGDDAARRHAVGRRLEVDEEPALEDEEELVVVVVLVPVILSLHDAESHDGIVDLAQRLVPPAIGDGGDHGIERDGLQRRKADVEMRGVGIGGGVGSGRHGTRDTG